MVKYVLGSVGGTETFIFFVNRFMDFATAKQEPIMCTRSD